MLMLDEEAVRPLLKMDALIEAEQQALIAFSAGRVIQPVRQVVEIPAHEAFFLTMPAVAEAMGIKLVTFYPRNAATGLHTHHALIVLFDPQTGEPLAVMDGRLITEMRTAAVSAVATRLLAAEDAGVLAMLGSGVQARSHVEAMRLVRPIREIRVWSRTPAHAERFAEEVGGRAMSAEEAVRGADIVVTATPSMQPIVKAEWLKEGAHVNAVGWNGPDSRELDDATLQRHPVFVESRAAVVDQCGDIRHSGASVTAEIGEALARPDPAWRDEITVFESVGMAIEDVTAAALVHAAARSA